MRAEKRSASPAAWAALVVAALGTRSATAQGKLPSTDALKPPPPVRCLTLEEARQRALANNKNLILARLNSAEKEYASAAAARDYFPKILGNVTYFHFNEDLGSVAVSASGRHGLLAAGTPLLNVAALNQDSTLSTVFAAQPLTKLIAVHALVQIARADEGVAQAKLDKGTREILTGVSQVYYGLLGAQRIQAALELQVRLLERMEGARANPDLRVALVEARQGLVQARGQVRELTDQFNDLLDLPRCTVLELVDPLPPPPPVRCADEAAQLALVGNPDVREAEEGVAKAEAALKIARMDYLPDVNVIGGYANQTAANYIEPNVGYLGVTGSYTFWDWGKRKQVHRQRETTVALAYQNVQVIRDKVELEARKAYSAFSQALEAYGLASEMVLARKDAEKGVVDPAALLTAKGATAKAELEFMKAELAYRVAHAQLMGLLGALP
jgi:outer membrane protein TolC